MRLILAKLLWHFDIAKPNMRSEDPDNVEGWMNRLKYFFLWDKPPLMVEVKIRPLAQ
jgi:averantin hydroxylase